MDRLRQVTLVLAVGAACGCAATDRLTAHYTDARRAVGMESAPASQVMLVMQRKLQPLPDPLHPDATQNGLPGQVFLQGSDGRPVPADGDLTVVVADETPGRPAKTTEKWHFGRDILARLRQKDERFGDCYILFLPWPADWKDVTRVTVKAVFAPANGVTLYAPEVQINLDVSPDEMRQRWQQLDAVKGPVRQPSDTPPFQPIQLPPPAVVTPSIPLPPPTPTRPDGPVTVTLPKG